MLPLTENSSALRSKQILSTALLLFVFGGTGCWEQASVEWWPQMKWQKAVQAFEVNDYQDRVALFSPPEGTVPVGWGDVAIPSILTTAEQEALVNPQKATLVSLKNGETLFNVNCVACHGPTGAGDGPIAAPNGPIAGVLPIGPGSPLGFNLAANLSDGHIYTTISIGRGRMPNYKRISPDGRWDIVNYLRDLAGQGGQ
ncbi:MAG TPA: cytochrome c [Myxococcales bacterium]|nr:cytochrome c [Myxococcales bacterium]HIK84932.1 cytochrome c [Myxococcales bacterium]